ncbi:hypothetical protein E3E11_07670 [Oecophyllibacter saccharovorans]|uniref:phosphorylase family protein n=1 Tax=Oecophyllibacter saccharovorans TaxID=2558360 RepID=UPI00114171A6|nr:hypothetical protein [Oecophyllibacter saccharovorans]QDH15743.1 hypothetical protein E3E11_07670 [Oecophyllibacter saccharovorans]
MPSSLKAGTGRLGIMVGLREEGRLIERFFPQAVIALSHAHEAGARRALQQLRQGGAEELLSFGCAGGLDPALKPGTILLADSVVAGGERLPSSEGLSRQFDLGRGVMHGAIVHSPVMVGEVAEKRALHSRTKALAVDMESGVVAQSGLPFAVLRVICDDAARPLPPAAASGLREGRVYLPGLLGSLVRQPGQIGALMALGRDAAQARASMKTYLENLAELPAKRH